MNFKPYISLFKNVRERNCITIHLATYFESYRSIVDHIRSIVDPKKRALAKEACPAVTMAGVFTGKGDKYLADHSGLICIDIDAKDNGHIENFPELKYKMTALPYLAYAGASISGIDNGFFLLIPIAYPEKHKGHFDAIAIELKEKFDLNVDRASRNVGALRYVSYDDAPVWNWKAAKYEPVYTEPNKVVTDWGGYNLNTATLDSFNEGHRAAQIIEQHGWKHLYNKGKWVYYNRPHSRNKSKIDGAIQQEKNFFICFSDNAGFEPKKCHSPFMLFTILEHQHDYAKAFRAIKIKASA